MSNLRAIVSFVLLSFVMLGLAACGSSGSGGSDPFASSSQSNTGTNTGPKTGPIFGNVSTVTGKTGITLATDVARVDAATGQVVATAKVISDGGPVSGVSVKFSIVAPLSGPATIESGLATVTTDYNGQAVTRITTGNATSTTNVILAATATIGTQSATATTTFQIVRGTGVISAAPIPAQTETVDPTVQQTVVFPQQISTRLTDANGNARVGVPVSMSVYTKSGASSVAIAQPIVTTDATGAAIFSANVTMASPSPGANAVGSVIYKLSTTDVPPIVAYAPSYCSVTAAAGSGGGVTVNVTTDRSIYDATAETVTATAKVMKNGVAVSGSSVRYEILSGPVSVRYFTPTTDANGTSLANLSVSSSKSAANVILKATATVDGKLYISYTQFQINGYDPAAEPVPAIFMTLTSDRTQVDVNNGTVMLNANLIFGTDVLTKNTDGTSSYIAHGTYVADQAVSFRVTSGPADITGSTPLTDKNGNSKAILTTRDTPITTNVIVEASTTYNGTLYRAYTTLQIVRGGGVIMFTSAAGQEPGTQTSILPSYDGLIDVPLNTPTAVTVVQLIPFKLTDSNGNPRVGVPVTLSLYSITGNQDDVTIDFLVPPVTEPTQQTITTDSAGMGIYNATVRLNLSAGQQFTASTAVFKAKTNDRYPVTAYVGRSYSLTRKTTTTTP